jgi:hypothetical protein
MCATPLGAVGAQTRHSAAQATNPALTLTTAAAQVRLFLNAADRYRHITGHAVDRAIRRTGGPLQLRYDARGRAVIEAEFTEAGARIVLFGAR